ncbi:MAG: hypothetical protein FWC43_05135 [Planctomycetaceae bacterium]|nr:hypothetical protein [Planctomycetaceae bacterium]
MRFLLLILSFWNIVPFLLAQKAEEPDVLPGLSKKATLLEIPLPITRGTVQPIYRSLLRVVEELRNTPDTTLVLSFRVPPGQDVVALGSQFGPCFDLAHLLASEEFQKIKTVAYFPQSVQGHALLVALATGEWIVSDTAEIGNAGVNEPRISPTIRQAYLDMGRRFPKQIVLKMLDPAVELWRAETATGTVWTDQAGVRELRTEGTLAKDPDAPFLQAGAPGLFTAVQARQQLGIADYLTPSDEGEIGLAKALGLKPEQISFAKVYTNTGRAVRVDLIGPITTAKISEVERQIRKATEENASLLATATGQNVPEDALADFVCLWIESSGGSLADSLNLAGYLANDIDPMKVRTVAYVPNKALADSALIALACQEVVIGPNAILGGSGEANFTPEEIRAAVETISQSLAKKSLRRWSLMAAIIDPNLEVFQYSRKSTPGIVEYFSEQELESQGDKDDWIKGEIVTRKGLPLETRGKMGVSFYLADKIATDFNEFKLFYHLENDPTLLEPGWADQLIRTLANPYLSATLLLIGFLALFVEMKTPGIGVGAFVAICCFVLFFWSKFLGGTAGWFEVSLFLTGVLFVLLEIFVVPGFGIFGIGGGAMILASLVLASQTFIIPRNPYQLQQFQNSLLVLVIALVGLCSIAGVLVRWLHEINRPKDTEYVRESEKLADYAYLLGQTGTALTPLVPSGKAMFGMDTISVVSDCELIESGSPVRVVDVRGYRVVVQKV